MVIKLPKVRWMRTLTLAAAVAMSAPQFVQATDSGAYSYRAQKSFDAGKYARGYKQLEKALLASRKEADLLSEGRVLLAMAQIRNMSLDYDMADSLLSVVRPDRLDRGTKVLMAQVKMSIANGRGDYKSAASICSDFNKDDVDKADEPTQAVFYSECAIAQAGANRNADESLKMTAKRSGKKSGFYAFTAARVAELGGNISEADSLYKVAEAKAIQGNKPYNTATILYIRSNLKSTPKNEAEDLRLRCKNAFELMGLPNNSKRCGE